MDYEQIKQAFLTRHGIGSTDWPTIETALRNENPVTCRQIAASLAMDWTEHKDETTFAKPSDELVEYVRGVLPGSTDPFNVRESELISV